MEKLFIGIDISKDVFDYCFLNQDCQILLRGTNHNDEKGIKKFIRKVKSFKDYKVWLSMEHTGHYGYLLALKFNEAKFDFTLINPLELKRSIGMVRGKDDAIDAYRIAYYSVVHSFKLKPYQLPIEELRKLKVLMATRDRYVKISVQLKNGLKAIKIAAKTMNIKELLKDSKASIDRIEKNIKSIEKEMLEIIKSNKSLKRNYSKITKVIGVGPIVALKCIIETDNFNSFTNGRKFSCHCGLVPFKYQSGSSIRGKSKTSSLSNKALKGLFYKAAVTAKQHDPQLKAYYNRKREEGKHKISALNAVANKVVLRIFAVINREEPFVKFYH